MKKTLTIFGFLLATSALFSQSISANFQTDMEGWTSHQSTVEWANLFAPMNDRGGISFARENAGVKTSYVPGFNIRVNYDFLLIQKEVLELLQNTRYRITFNMNWLAWLESGMSPIIVKVGAMSKPPTYSWSMPGGWEEIVDDGNTVFQSFAGSRITDLNFNRGELGQDGRDFVVAGQLTPNENGLAFTQNINNFDNAFYVNTDDEGRLFLMIGIETENPKIENVFLNTLRVVLREVRETLEVQEDEKIEEDEEKTDYENEIEI